jgi:hypothetical protein
MDSRIGQRTPQLSSSAVSRRIRQRGRLGHVSRCKAGRPPREEQGLLVVPKWQPQVSPFSRSCGNSVNVIIGVMLAVLLCCFAIAVFVASRGSGIGEDVQRFAFVASWFFGGISVILGIAVADDGFTTPQRRAERDLRFALERTDRGR